MPPLSEIQAEKARRRLSHFVRYAWPTVEPGTPLAWNWHIDAICEHLEAVTRGDIRKLLINVPPGHMKSLIVSVFWPAWVWLQRPSWQGLFGSYAGELAIRDSVRCRDVITSNWYQESFSPKWVLKGDQNVKSYFKNDMNGSRFCLSVTGKATGFRGDDIVVDDPINVNDAHSARALEYASNWWDKTMSSRMNDMRKGAKVIIMQRVNEADLSGHVLSQGGYVHLCLPSEYDPARRCVTSIGWEDPRTAEGELLCPEMFPESVIEEAKVDLGPDDFAGQHQQLPAPAEGLIFKADWFETRWTTLPEIKEVFTIWDTALKDKQINDETACMTGAAGVDGNLYILRIASGRWPTPEVEKFLFANADYWIEKFGDKYRGDYVEDKVSGTTLMQYAKRERPDLAVIGIDAEKDKVTRAHGVTPICAAGRVLFPDTSAMPEQRNAVNKALSQILAFPNAKLDDILDTFVYLVRRYQGNQGKKKGIRRSTAGGIV